MIVELQNEPGVRWHCRLIPQVGSPDWVCLTRLETDDGDDKT